MVLATVGIAAGLAPAVFGVGPLLFSGFQRWRCVGQGLLEQFELLFQRFMLGQQLLKALIDHREPLLVALADLALLVEIPSGGGNVIGQLRFAAAAVGLVLL